MPFIENIGLHACAAGFHFDPGPNSVLIQIVDPDCVFPEPKIEFKKTFRFKFLDIEEEGHVHSITDQQAESIAKILQEALDKRSNVIVHCHAGICRSGAVAEVGIMMGFQDTEVYRCPNLLVKRKLIEKVFNNE